MRSAGIAFCLVASGSLAACSGPTPEETDNSLKAATALAVPVPASDFDKIEIVSKELQKAKWVWQARIDGKTYACDADDQMRLPSCQAAG